MYKNKEIKGSYNFILMSLGIISLNVYEACLPLCHTIGSVFSQYTAIIDI